MNLLTGTNTNARVAVVVGIFPINSGKCLVKKSSELDHHNVSVPRAMPVVSVACVQTSPISFVARGKETSA